MRKAREEMKTLAQEMQTSLGNHPEVEEPAEFSDLSYDCWELWMVTQDDTAPMGDRDEAAAQLMDIAENGNPDAQYLVSKLYRDGPVLIPDSVEAHYWFTQSSIQGNQYAQFFLDRCDNLKSPSIVLSVSRLLHHMSRIFQDRAPAPPIPGGIQIDRKRLAQLREKKMAMGHKADDYEEQAQNWTMTMGWPSTAPLSPKRIGSSQMISF